MEKGTRILTATLKTTFRIAGRWGRDIVLEDTTRGSDMVMIYEEREFENMLKEGLFIELNSIGEPIKR